MVFVSPIFIFIFLPAVLVCYAIAELTGKKTLKNMTLLGFSLIFYSWGGVSYLLLLMISILVNYLFGRLLEVTRYRKEILIVSVIYNVGILFIFKYFNFFIEILLDTANLLHKSLPLSISTITLPIGISFFTFQIMSYIFDVYWNKVEAQHNILDLALYIMLFPQLIAGPIVRYIDVNQQIRHRHTTLEMMHEGIIRFILGFNKKIFLANGMGYVADIIFGNISLVNTPYAWLGAVCYGLQIYMDFSSYSDMAIGLGKLFGFCFLESFQYPYISSSIKEFWRRWHISLSSWFRDYVYIPLGGNRHGKKRTYQNLLIVFVLTGFWHGANWTFVIWGLFHGIFLILERGLFGRLLEKLPRIFQRIYTLIVVLVGWVFFRCNTITDACLYLKIMFMFDCSSINSLELLECFDREFVILFLLSLAGSLPLIPILKNQLKNHENVLVGIGADLGLLALFAYAVCYMVGTDFNPFIYFRF